MMIWKNVGKNVKGWLFLTALVSTAACVPVANAIDLTSSGTYTQNFDSLPNTGTTVWTDDSTLAGWYYLRTIAGTNSLIASPGTSTTGALYSFGAAASTDRALGALASGSTGTLFFGVEFFNNTGSDITFNALSFVGEQWRVGSVNPNTLAFSYLTSSTPISLSAGSWTPDTNLDFTSPVESATAVAINPPSTLNLSDNLNVTLSAGSYIMFRWQKLDNTGGDDGLAVDDLSIAYSMAAPVTSSVWTGPLGTGGSGTWTQTGGTNWSGAAWSTNSKAIFGNSPGTVTVSGTVSAALGIEFDVDGYNITGGEIALTGSTAGANTLAAATGVTASVSSVLSGSNGFTKAGNGTIALSGSNTFSGNVSVTGGLLQIADDSNLGVASNGVVLSGGGLKTVSNVALNSSRTVSGVGVFDVADSTALTVNGSFNMSVTTLSNTGTLNLQGSTRNVGSLNFNAAGSLAGAGTITATGLTATNLTSGIATITAPLDLGSSLITVDVGGGGEVSIQGGLTFGGTTTNYITKTGSGILDVAAGSNAISRWRIGTGTTDGGILQIHDSAGAGQNQMFFNYGTLQAANDLTGVNAIAIGLSIGGRAGLLPVLAGSDMQFNGATTLFESSGVKTFLDVENKSTFTGTFTSSATVGDSFVITGNGTAVIKGNGSGMVRSTVVTGNATLVIDGSWGASINVDVAAKLKGTGTIAGAIDVSGVYNVGDEVGQQTAQAGVTMRNGSAFQWDLVANSNTTAGTDFDQLLVAGGNVTIESGVTLALNFSGPGSTVDWSDSFWDSTHTWTIEDMLGAGSLAGMFAMSDPSTWLDANGDLLSSVHSLADFTVDASGQDIVLTYSPVPEPSSISLLLGSGFFGFLVWRKVRRRRAVVSAS